MLPREGGEDGDWGDEMREVQKIDRYIDKRVLGYMNRYINIILFQERIMIHFCKHACTVHRWVYIYVHCNIILNNIMQVLLTIKFLYQC